MYVVQNHPKLYFWCAAPGDYMETCSKVPQKKKCIRLSSTTVANVDLRLLQLPATNAMNDRRHFAHRLCNYAKNATITSYI